MTYYDPNFNTSTLTASNVTLDSTRSGSAAGTAERLRLGHELLVTISGMTGNGTLGISIAAGTASDLAGNLAAASGPSTTFVVDTTAPTITVTGPSAAYANAATTETYTVTYYDANFNTSTLSKSNITLLNPSGSATGTVSVSGSGTSYQVTISGITGTGTLGISIAAGTASDLAGNLAPASVPSTTFIVDTTAPMLTIGSPSVSSTSSGPVTYTVTYADTNFNTSTLTTSNISLNPTGTASGTLSLSGSGTSYQITISSITGSGTLGFTIAAGTASDLAGNLAPAETSGMFQVVGNQPPALSGNSSSVTFICGSTPLAVAPGLTISDTGSSYLSSATVSIAGLADTNYETLAATTMGTNITASYNGATGVLTLSGSDTLAHYQQVLESVTYVDSLLGTTNLGNRTLSFSVTDANNLSSTAVSTTVAFDVAPTVTGVYVSGSSWVTAYYNTLTSAGVGSSLGYELASGAGQLTNANVPGWTNLNTITIVFDKPVSGLTLSSFALGDSSSNNNTGAGATSSGITITGETNVSSTEAQLTLSGPLPSNKYYVEVLATGVTDAAGATLDGLWTTSVSSFAAGSGNGRRGATSFTSSMSWRVPSCATAGFRRRMSPSCGASRWGATRPPLGRTTSTATTG